MRKSIRFGTMNRGDHATYADVRAFLARCDVVMMQEMHDQQRTLSRDQVEALDPQPAPPGGGAKQRADEVVEHGARLCRALSVAIGSRQSVPQIGRFR